MLPTLGGEMRDIKMTIREQRRKFGCHWSRRDTGKDRTAGVADCCSACPARGTRMCSNLQCPDPVGALQKLFSTARIQVSHHDVKHLPGASRIALRNRRLRVAIAVGIGRISICPGD